MSSEQLVLCGGVPLPSGSGSIKALKLSLWGPQKNAELRITDISRPLVTNIPSLLVDLLEIAAYVYCADQATTRGGDGAINLGKNWRRTFNLHIPVRECDVWSSEKIKSKLADTLGFLSDDYFQFQFYPLKTPPAIETYFDFSSDSESNFKPESVILFSGGLDSLAGAVQETVLDKRKVVMVSHRSSPKIANNLKALLPELKKHATAPTMHIPIWINKEKELGKEYTQRTRSFLYASLAAVVARLFKMQDIKFYENGVLSFNLPIAEQVLSTRATRSTHPRVLSDFSDFFTELFGLPFRVENPFIWKTKTEMVRVVSEARCEDLIKNTISCMHTWERTKLLTHCGRCSQCIDRRFAVLASGNEINDPEEMYKVDLLTGHHEPGIDISTVESYVKTATEVNKMDDNGVEFFSRFPEATKAISYLKDHGTPDEVASKIMDLHKRHAKSVCQVLVEALKNHAEDIHAGRLPETCVTALAVPQKYKQKLPTTDKVPNGFATPAGAAWSDVKMKYLDGHTLSVTVGKIKKRVGFQHMGMANNKNNMPNKQWELLSAFAEGHGVLTWDNPRSDRRNQKQREVLSKKLRTYFGIQGDPIKYVPSTKGWKTRFEIEPEIPN